MNLKNIKEERFQDIRCEVFCCLSGDDAYELQSPYGRHHTLTRVPLAYRHLKLYPNSARIWFSNSYLRMLEKLSPWNSQEAAYFVICRGYSE